MIVGVAACTTVYARVPKPKDERRDPHAPLPGDSEAVAQWRVRMGTDQAKAIYKDRAATAECVNAQARNRGLGRFNVQGLSKVTSVRLWYALAHNLIRIAGDSGPSQGAALRRAREILNRRAPLQRDFSVAHRRFFGPLKVLSKITQYAE